jgi:hypothetical protein
MPIVADSGIPVLDDGTEQSVKVTTVNDQTIEEPVVSVLFSLLSATRDSVEQLKLLNARFEEAFDTKIDEKDIV